MRQFRATAQGWCPHQEIHSDLLCLIAHPGSDKRPSDARRTRWGRERLPSSGQPHGQNIIESGDLEQPFRPPPPGTKTTNLRPSALSLVSSATKRISQPESMNGEPSGGSAAGGDWLGAEFGLDSEGLRAGISRGQTARLRRNCKGLLQFQRLSFTIAKRGSRCMAPQDVVDRTRERKISENLPLNE